MTRRAPWRFFLFAAAMLLVFQGRVLLGPQAAPDEVAVLTKAWYHIPPNMDYQTEYHTPNLLADGSFETWVNGIPGEWACSDPESLFVTREALHGGAALLVQGDPSRGQVVLSHPIRAGRLVLNYVRPQLLPAHHRIHDTVNVHRTRVRAGVMAKASAPATCTVAVEYVYGKQYGEFSNRVAAAHPGDGEWHEVWVIADMICYTDPDRVAFKITASPGVLLDDASVRLKRY